MHAFCHVERHRRERTFELVPKRRTPSLQHPQPRRHPPNQLERNRINLEHVDSFRPRILLLGTKATASARRAAKGRRRRRAKRGRSPFCCPSTLVHSKLPG